MLTESEAITVLFQGDSVTDACRDRGIGDPGHMLGHGYPNLVAGDVAQRFPQRRITFLNRGCSGDRASDLYARWNEDALSLRPDLISILVGVNDVWRCMKGEPSGAFDRYERAYRGILEDTAEFLPDCGLALCEPFILNTGAPAEDWPEWSRRIHAQQEIVRELAAEFGAAFVPLQAEFDTASHNAPASWWLYDGVHPSPAGHRVIANAWIRCCLEP
jgi:Lysophospholipase L1 and related esterases